MSVLLAKGHSSSWAVDHLSETAFYQSLPLFPFKLCCLMLAASVLPTDRVQPSPCLLVENKEASKVGWGKAIDRT